MKNLFLSLFLMPLLLSAQSQFWQYRLKVDVSAAGSQDQTFIYFSDQATDNFDPVWDSYKTPSAAGQPTLYTRIAGNTGILSINAFSLDYLGNPITLGLQPGTAGTFTLIFQYTNEMPAGSVLYLHDMRDDVWQNLMMDSTYTFDMMQTDSNDRFEIFTSPSPIAYGVDDLCSSDAGFAVDLPSILIDGQITSWDYLLSNSMGIEVESGSTTGMDTIEVSTTDEYTIVVSFDGITSTFTDSVTIGAPVSVTLPADITSNAGEAVSVMPTVSTMGGMYSWLLDGTEVGMDATLDYTFLTEGTYSLVLNYVSADGCEVSEDMTITVLGTNSLEDFLHRYAIEYLTIQNEVLYIGMNQIESITEVILMDAKGQVLHAMRPHGLNSTIDLSGYAQGVYYLGVVSNKGSEFIPIQF